MNGVTIKEYMENWLNAATYPSINLVLDNSGTETQIKFFQERFYFSDYDSEIDDGPAPNET